MFNPDIMQPTNVPEGTKAVFDFGKYELSVVQNQMSYGSQQGLFEISVFEGNNQVELPGITEKGDSVKGFLTEDNVNAILKKMATITGINPTLV